MSKSSAKKIKVLDDKKGWVEIGSLSKNELCRGVKELMIEGQKLQNALNYGAFAYNNHMASWDAMSSQEMVELSNYHNLGGKHEPE